MEVNGDTDTNRNPPPAKVVVTLMRSEPSPGMRLGFNRIQHFVYI